jgi:hypothetical protein
MSQLGHTDPTTTLGIYAKVMVRVMVRQSGWRRSWRRV